MNIFITRHLTEYDYRIYSFLATWPNANFKYISFLATWPNPNIEYIRNKKIEYSNSNMYYLVLNILIFKYIRVTKGVEGKFLKSLIHIYADLRRFCSLLVRLCKRKYICKMISLNTIIEYICSLQPDRIGIWNIFVPRNLTKY